MVEIMNAVVQNKGGFVLEETVQLLQFVIQFSEMDIEQVQRPVMTGIQLQEMDEMPLGMLK